jgi:hypothetical protein
MQAAGAITVNDQIKTISAVKPSRGSGQSRAKNKRGGENVRWKRLTDNFDELVRLGANPAFIAPLPRLVFFKHLTPIQGLAGLKYASIMRMFERYHIAPGMRRTTKSQSFEPVRGSEDQELERRINNGTIGDYEDDARKARNQHKRLMKVMDAFKDPITGRNFAKDMVESLVLLDQEPPSNMRADIGRVLSAVAKEFDVTDKPKRRK